MLHALCSCQRWFPSPCACNRTWYTTGPDLSRSVKRPFSKQRDLQDTGLPAMHESAAARLCPRHSDILS